MPPQNKPRISGIRATVARVSRITVDYLHPEKIIARFVELMAKKAALGLATGAAMPSPAQGTLF
jgi:hypothetical protein